MSYTETVNPKRRWDLTDVAAAIGIVSVVVGVGMFSIAAALIVGGIALVGLVVLWPKP